MNRLNIGTRLVLSFLLILTLLAVLAGIGIWRILDSSSKASDITDQRLASERLISDWSRGTALNAERTIALSKIHNRNVRQQLEKVMADTSANIEGIRAELATRLSDPKALELFEMTKTRQSEYTERREEAIRAQAEGKFQTANRFFEEELEDVLGAYTKSVDDLLVYERELINADAAQLHQDNSTGLKLLIGLSLAAFAAGLLLAFSITRSITAPLRRSVAFATTVSSRDLTGTIDVQGTDETSRLLHALKQMNSNLLDVVGDVRTGADSIASAANQIAAGNIDLSSRTQEQASSLAETATAMEQLTVTVRQNADRAEQANELTDAAAQVAVESGEVVAKVVRTMGAISDSSKQVVDIVDVIDSIAFQTNILALNAAVEAARAGEQGRGFAVVASEVRALAQRSASAAREIKTLIDASVATTEEGNTLVVEAGTRMNETVASIQRVRSIMDEMTAASHEQSVGIDQVNQAVVQMDHVTQQNAALVEESAAAADSLRDQAAELARLVATFKLEERESSSAQPVLASAAPAIRLALEH